jgi:hypothetical protein
LFYRLVRGSARIGYLPKLHMPYTSTLWQNCSGYTGAISKRRNFLGWQKEYKKSVNDR